MQEIGDMGSVPGLARSPGGGHGNPRQYSCLENPHGQRSPAGYSTQGHKELDTTEATEHARTYTVTPTPLDKALSTMPDTYKAKISCILVKAGYNKAS